MSRKSDDKASRDGWDFTPRLHSAEQIRSELFGGISDRTFRKMLAAGAFPGPNVKLSQKTRFWTHDLITSWVESKSRE